MPFQLLSFLRVAQVQESKLPVHRCQTRPGSNPTTDFKSDDTRKRATDCAFFFFKENKKINNGSFGYNVSIKISLSPLQLVYEGKIYSAGMETGSVCPASRRAGSQVTKSRAAFPVLSFRIIKENTCRELHNLTGFIFHCYLSHYVAIQIEPT